MNKYFNDKIYFFSPNILMKEHTKAPSTQSLMRNSDIHQAKSSSDLFAKKKNYRLVLALARTQPPAFFCLAARL
jgi:hypothetical protein